MTKKKEKSRTVDEVYRLTFKGLLVASGLDERAVQSILDSLELYLRRFHMVKPGEIGAIIFTGKEWVITSVEERGGEDAKNL